METPQIRPGLVKQAESMPRVVAFFHNSAQGNLAIQLLTQIGIPNDRLGVTPPEQIEGGQGMILSIACPDEKLLAKVESICRCKAAGSTASGVELRRPSTASLPGALSMPLRSSQSNRLPWSPVLVWRSRLGPGADRPGPGGPLVRPGRAHDSNRGADPPVQRQGLDRILHLSARAQVRRSQPGLHGPRRHDPDLGRGVRRIDDAGRVPRLSPDRRMEVGRADLGLAEGQDARDSGILLHCVGPDGAAGGNWMESQECQIIEGGCGDFIMVNGREKPSLTCETRVGPDRQLYFEKGGKAVTRNSGRFNWWGRDPAWKDVLGFRGSRDVEKPAGEWNRMEVICDGDSITNIVNGYVVNVGTKSSLTKGKIMFQSEGAEIFFRKIEVRPLDREGSITHRAAVLARVGAADQDAALEVDADRLVAAEAAADLDEPVPLGLELRGGLRGRSPTRARPCRRRRPAGRSARTSRSGGTGARRRPPARPCRSRSCCRSPARAPGPACRPPSGRSSARACRPW